MNAKALAGGLYLVACLVSTNATAWNTVSDPAQYRNMRGNTHLYIVNEALGLLAAFSPFGPSPDPVAWSALQKMANNSECKDRWMKGLNDGDNNSSYVDDGRLNGSQGTHFWNSSHPKGWPRDNWFNALMPDNTSHHDNAREQADKYIGKWRDTEDCYWLGLALHYVTDLSQPMHVANVIGPRHAEIEVEISQFNHSSWALTDRSPTGTTLSGTRIWPPQPYDTASWALTQVTLEVWNEGRLYSPYELTWGGDRRYPVGLDLRKRGAAVEDAQPWAARYIYGLFNRSFAVGSIYRSNSLYTKDLPGQAAGWDWAPFHYKATCPLGQPMTGISKSFWTEFSQYSAYMARNVQCRNDNPGKFAPVSCRVKNAEQGQNQDETMRPQPDWAPQYWKTTCAKNEYVFGISQSTTGNLASILCCSANNLDAKVANARGLDMVRGNGVEEGSETSRGHDWSWGDWKGECGPGRYIIGVARVSEEVGHVGYILCVN